MTGTAVDRRHRWEREATDWPHRSASRFITAAGLHWHVQDLGSGPVVLLLHGTGAATHSWRHLAPLLAQSFRVIAPDLPGHGYTGSPPPGSLHVGGFGQALAGLLRELGIAPGLVVGHSAGAAIAVRMILDGQLNPRGLVSLNGALLPLGGPLNQFFMAGAKLLAQTPFMPWLLWRQVQDPRVVARLLRDTGSRLDPAALELYGRLARNPDHVAAVLGMMARWDLNALERELPRLAVPLLVVGGGRDGMVPASAARRIHGLVPASRLELLPGHGHLAHEEDGETVARLVLDFAATLDGLPPGDQADGEPRSMHAA